ncbi:MAG: hypothetical protein MJ211_09485 [Bacteroidales bacterium]|nr:hypothetical protein [Bacteroidales bacterium]
MKIKLLICILLTFLAYNNINAQILYEFKYQYNGDNYLGLLTFTDFENCKLRIFNERFINKDGCKEQNYCCMLGARNNKNCKTFVPSDCDTINYFLPCIAWFDYIDDNEKAWIFFNKKDFKNENNDWIETEYFKEVDLLGKDKKFYLQYFNKKEPFYLNIIEAQKKLKQQNKKK